MADFDSPWKEAIEGFFEPFLAFLFPDISQAIDWSRGYEWLDKELLQIMPESEQGKRFVDKLVKVWLRDGTENWVLVHIEVQTQPDDSFTERMYVYNYRVFDRYNRRVVSLAILGDDRAEWRPERFGYEILGCRVDFRFRIAKLIDFASRAAELELHESPFALLVLAHLKSLETRDDAADRLQWKTRLIRVLLEHGWNEDRVLQLFRIIDWFVDLPDDASRIFWNDVQTLQQEKKMPFVTTPERIGREEGRKEGIREGQKEGLREAAQLQLAARFPGERALVAALESTNDIDVLRELLRQLAANLPLESIRALLKPNLNGAAG